MSEINVAQLRELAERKSHTGADAAEALLALPELLRELETLSKDASIKQAHITRLWDFLVENFGAKPDVTFADGPCEYAMKLLSAERERVIQECAQVVELAQKEYWVHADNGLRETARRIRTLTKPSAPVSTQVKEDS